MAFFDKIAGGITEFGQGALQKTKDGMDSMKISSLVREEEAKQKELYTQIGRLFFQEYANHAEGQFRDLCNQILNSKNQILQYQEQLSILKGVTYCPNCNAEVPYSSSFCSSCGQKIEHKPVAKNTVATKRCPNCNAEVDGESFFCCNCGYKMEEQPVNTVVHRCVNCGEKLEENQSFCTNCGTRVAVSEPNQELIVEEEVYYKTCDQQEVEPEPEVMQTEQVTCCPNCGKELNEGQHFCTGCGTKL